MSKEKTDFTQFTTAHPNYFPGQYLLEDDFELQHKYLSDRQRYNNHSLHVSGIIEGLEVEVIQDRKVVLIKSGSAINNLGELIILATDIEFSDFTNIINGELYFQYSEEKQIKQQEDIDDSYTRWVENPLVGFAATTPDNGVKLATLTISGNNITLDGNIREYSGLSLPNSNSKALTLRSGGNENPNLAVLTGSLEIDGDLKIAGGIRASQGQQVKLWDYLQVNGGMDITGNLGIGTNDSGNYRLNVQGNQYISGDLTVNQKIEVVEKISVGEVSTDSKSGIYWNSSDNYGIYRTSGPWTENSYQQLKIKWSTGIILEPGTGNDDGYAKSYVDITGGKGLRVTQGNVGIGTNNPGSYKLNVQGDQYLKGNLTIKTGKVTVDGNQQIIFTDGDITNNLKIQLWSGFGLGINPSTLFYTANGKHSWRDSQNNERMWLTTGANGGLTVKGKLTFADNTFKPFELKKFTGGDNPDIDTGYSSTEWIVIIAGFSVNADRSSGTQSTYTYVKQSKWWIRADVSEQREQGWTINILAIRRNWVNLISKI